MGVGPTSTHELRENAFALLLDTRLPANVVGLIARVAERADARDDRTELRDINRVLSALTRETRS